MADINPYPYIYYIYISEVYKHLETRCQVVQQPQKCVSFFYKQNLLNVEVHHENPM